MAALTTSNFVGEPQRELYQCEDIVGDFKRLIVQLAGSIDDEDTRKKIRYLYKDKLGPGAEKMTALEVLEKLEEKGVFSAKNLPPLENLLKDSDHHDLIETHLEPYRSKYTHWADERATLHHSLSSPMTSVHPSALPRPTRSTSSPVSIGSNPSTSRCKPTHYMSSIEEHRTVEDPQSPSQSAMYVYGQSTANFSSIGMRTGSVGIGMSSGRSQRSGIGGRPVTESRAVFSQCSLPADLSRCDEDRRKNKSSVSDPQSHVTEAFQPVSFELGKMSATGDVESQFNFPMDAANFPSAETSPGEMMSKVVVADTSLTDDLKRSFQFTEERTRTNTPHTVAETTSVEATEHGNGDSCIVASQAKACSPTNPSVYPQRREGEDARSVQQCTGGTLSSRDAGTCASMSIECANPDRKWHSKPATFLLNREKMATMISKHKTTRYKRCFKLTIPISNSKKGVLLSVEIFPFGLESDTEPHYATVLVHVSLRSSKCQEIAEHCKSIVEVKTTFVNSANLMQLSVKKCQAELCPKSCDACIQVKQALSHEDIIYSKTKEIQLIVEATFWCKDKVTAEPLADEEHPDYLQVNIVPKDMSSSKRE